jgi:hypothetical protein
MKFSLSNSDTQQRSVSTGETLEDHSQDTIHSAENFQVELYDAEFIRMMDGRKETINFPPASAKPEWDKLDKSLIKSLNHHLKGLDLEHKLETFGDIIYYHCVKEFGTKEVTQHKKTT